MKQLFLLLLLGVPFLSFADLRPSQFSITISCDKQVVSPNECFQITIRLANLTGQNQSILIPGAQNKGKRLIQLEYYQVTNNFYTKVAEEIRTIQMDTSERGSVYFKRLDPKESYEFPIFLNDSVNYSKHIQSNYRLPKLAPGTYQVLAWYLPWDEELAKYAFQLTTDFDKNPIEYSEEESKIEMPASGINSNYITLTIASDSVFYPKENTMNRCQKNCRFCAAIEHENWHKVERIIRHEQHDWRKPHNQLRWISPNPDAVLDILPTYSGNHLIFKTRAGIQYAYITYRIGKIYPVRQQLVQLFHLVFNTSFGIRTSSYKKVRMMGLTLL
jgi:hypothetical protein|uniref:hypothetical protein n=1 Tax=Fluviicola sp. TaxID=1917219 RepID=UPI00404AD983